MQDSFLDRLWADHHQRFSADVGGLLDRAAARLKRTGGDPLPIAGKALAAVLAVSLASLSLGAVVV
jgi:hypothetical protein